MSDSSTHTPPPFRPHLRFVAVLLWCSGGFWASSRPDLRISPDDQLDFILRKAAHMGEFAVLVLLTAWALSGIGRTWRAATVGAWVFTLAWACSDEWHQTFVRGRVGHPSDVLIDMTGATIALAATGAVRRFRTTRPLEAAP